mgnify:CR=1 FL=1|tara:strand:+ start:133 stop:492 length:360 start_codon:yes stop_codon:yes gene_type:complete
MPKRLKEAGIKYKKGGMRKAQDGFVGPGGGFMNRLRNEGVGSALSGTFPARAGKVWVDETVDAAKNIGSGVKNFFGFKHGGHVKMKNGGNVPGMYKTGGMYDGMDSPQPKGISHKSFKK